ncbi:2-amino-4-hydroxy-6-hydroxymethyldihydropteridine pyrophosphokinase [Dirofilaria immitis]
MVLRLNGINHSSIWLYMKGCLVSSEELLRGLNQIECDIGRPQVLEKWEPCIIDLDILLWDDDLMLDTPHLTIPQPELMNRPFLLHLIAILSPMDNIPVEIMNNFNK